MFVSHLQKAITYIRETQELALFTTMVDTRLSAMFRISPLYYIMLPFIGLLLTINAIINGYQLVKSSNRNLDRWFLFATSTVCAVLASVSLYGAAISTILNLSFAAGAWFFLSSLIVALIHQTAMFGINLYRALECPNKSIQRMHYIQASLNHLFIAALLTAALGAVAFTLLFPIAPIVGMFFSLTAVLLTGINILWHMAPNSLKKTIKGWLHLNKPSLEEDARANQKELVKLKSFEEEVPKHHRLFTCHDYTAVIRTMDMEEIKPFLSRIIQYKLSLLSERDLENGQCQNKISLLKRLLQSLENHTPLSKKEMFFTYPLAFQSFFMEKGEVEQIFDAVADYHNRHVTIQSEELLTPIVG
ncbi:Uncharacterised protein [Legionella wadsworthii]|uniref:Uncharacterized protein n=1 Tax=Legionella wadsworthii TaxID=28088 RepID=A0A378LY67_9GAMM|nr:hypothetical protein [Legionella wadsworthii]STY29001.1 Uncharacterised protein [Legionella wadsworthii]